KGRLTSISTGRRDLPYLDMHFPQMPAGIAELAVWNAPHLCFMPSLPDSLKSLEMEDCPALKRITVPDTLSRLILSGMSSLELRKLPSHLKSLVIRNTPNLESFLPPLPNTLETLELTDTSGLSALPDSLKYLTIKRSQATALPQLPSGLLSLTISECPELTRF